MTDVSTPFRLFPLGQIVITAKAADRIELQDLGAGLQRHAVGDWGDLNPFDEPDNDVALEEEGRVCSAHADRHRNYFCILTQCVLGMTTVMTAEEYDPTLVETTPADGL